MFYAAHLNQFALSQPESQAGAKRAGVLRRIVNAIYQSPQEQDEQAAAYLIEQSGGRLTDDIERRMTSRLSKWDWYARN
jgi:hypothetical protein